MKKIILSIAAVAALAACTKSEVQYEQTGEITLAPVTNTVTKSVAGYDYGTSDNFHVNGNEGKFDGVFPNTIDLYVFANAQDENADGELIDSWTTPYFKKAHFVYDAGKGNESTQFNPAIPTTGAYKGETPLYWPNVKTLKFVGYSDACNVTSLTPIVADDLSTLTIEGYVQDNTKTAEGANDLMWFPVTQDYGKAEGEIPAQMKHACSWITVNVKGNDVTASNWTLNSLIVKNIAHKGTAECGEESATWETDKLGSYKDEDYYNAQTDDEFDPTEGTTFTTAYVEYNEGTANNFIVIPQTPTTLEVTYSYVSDTINNITFTETKSVELDYDGVAGNSKWESGVHYIYNLTITATEILIDPVVVEWTESVYDADKGVTGDQPIEI